MLYICELCGYNTKYKSHLEKHQNRKISCLHKKHKNMDKNNPLLNINFCQDCGLIIKHNKNIAKHKLICKKTFLDNIYNIDKKQSGNCIFGYGGGDIYILQIDYEDPQSFKIGGTTNINNILLNVRKKYNIEPLLHFIYPCQNIKQAKNGIKQIINTKYRDIYIGELDELQHSIIEMMKTINNNRVIEIEPEMSKIYKCAHCSQFLMGKKNIFQHIFNCNSNIIMEKNTEIDLLKQQVSELLEEKAILTKTQHITNNIINNNTINININGFNKEDLSYISKDFLTELCKLPYSSIKNLLKHIHFNKSHPENMNVMITNRKEQYAQVFNGKQWVCELKKVVIDDMVDRSYHLIDEHYESGGRDLLKFTQQSRFDNYQKKFEHDKEGVHNIKKEAELLMVNKGLLSNKYINGK